MLDVGNDLSGWFDLDQVPYTTRFSRLLVRRESAGLVVYRAAYERSMDDSVVAHSLRLLDAKGMEVPLQRTTALAIEFAGGARLVVTGDELVLAAPDRNYSWQWAEGPAWAEARIVVGSAIPEYVGQVVSDWLTRAPAVDPQWRDLVRFCWWVLGVNTLVLDAPEGLRRAVVPSKIGYVGLWQWDAYFIAIGLRHGDPELALEQLRIALAYQGADGQLPDVVHEDGILASSDDLPSGDLETLRELGSPALVNARVPLTKPPLTALAVAKLAEVLGAEVIDEFLPAMLRAQEWWYRDSAPFGRPAYLHPYSSGLDDSPIFDHATIVASPDLAAYLILSDRLLAGWLTERGRDREAAACTARADASVGQLADTWDADRGFFPAFGEDGSASGSEAIVSLMPVLATGLPADMVDGLADAIIDPMRFGTAHALPTVSASDPDFSMERMWRGPVWVNTNWLVAQGLRLQGMVELARRIEEGTLAMVAEHGPNEYFRPDTGVKPPRATTVFGWSAALAIDLAVSLSSATD